MTPSIGHIPYIIDIIPVFGFPLIPSTDQYLGPMEPQMLTLFVDMLCVSYNLNSMTQILKLFGVVFPNYQKIDIHRFR